MMECIYVFIHTHAYMIVYVYLVCRKLALRLRLKKTMCQAKVSVSTMSFILSGCKNGLHRRTDSAKLPGNKLFEPVPLPCEPVPCEPVPCEAVPCVPCEPVPCEAVPNEPVPCEPVPRGVLAFLSRSPKRTSKVGCLCHLCPKSQYTNIKEM